MYDINQEKIYPSLPSAPKEEEDEAQVYRLRKIEEVEKFLRDEIRVREKLSKLNKRRATALAISDGSVISMITILEIGSIVCISSGVGSAIGIALAGTGVLLGLGVVVFHKTEKILNSKASKHEQIKLLARTKLDCISSLVSKAIEDTRISHEKYQFILKEVEHYRKVKQEIRSKSKKNIDKMTAEQREAILAHGRKEGREEIAKKLVENSDIRTASAI